MKCNLAKFVIHLTHVVVFNFQVGDSGIIVLDNSLDSSNSEETEWEVSAGPPSPCDVAFCNDNVLINGRSNLSRQPRNHKVISKTCKFQHEHSFNILYTFIFITKILNVVMQTFTKRYRVNSGKIQNNYLHYYINGLENSINFWIQFLYY